MSRKWRLKTAPLEDEKQREAQPYPKSLAKSLFEKEFYERPQPSNSSEWTTVLDRKDSVALCAYLGVAPRRYLQLFRMGERKDAAGNSREAAWISNKRRELPRVPAIDAHVSYLPREQVEVERIRSMLRDRQ
jgi:hypothetical protein